MAEPTQAAPPEWVEEIQQLVRDLLPHTRHHSTCGVNFGSDCGSYHSPYCRLNWLRTKAALMLGDSNS